LSRPGLPVRQGGRRGGCDRRFPVPSLVPGAATGSEYFLKPPAPSRRSSTSSRPRACRMSFSLSAAQRMSLCFRRPGKTCHGDGSRVITPTTRRPRRAAPGLRSSPMHLPPCTTEASFTATLPS
jgi:hypothetical protein